MEILIPLGVLYWLTEDGRDISIKQPLNVKKTLKRCLIDFFEKQLKPL